MEKLTVLFFVIIFLLALVALLSWMLKITAQERNAGEDEIWRRSNEISRLNKELFKYKKGE